jgi:hypothetical protein
MQIILIHGMGRTRRSMAPLGAYLARQGHTVRYFGYIAAAEPFARIAQRLVRCAGGWASGQPYALVTHSLGGVLARAALPSLADCPPRQLVMLAPPNRPPLLARRLAGNPLFRFATGDCGRSLGDQRFYDQLAPVRVPTTIIAGTAGPRGRWSPFGAEPNDGVVAVAETRLAGAPEPRLVPAVHTLIMRSPQVARLVAEQLALPSE